MSATTNNEFMTPAQVAEMLGVQEQTLTAWRARGRYPGLRYVKVGRAVRYRRTDVEAWLDGRTYGHTGDTESTD